MTHADLVFVNGTVLTMDADLPLASTVAVRDGVIAHTGADAREWIGPRTEVVDLGGRVLLPGINDSHLHACGFGLNRPPFSVDVALGSIAAVRAAVADAVRHTPPGEWIRGTGWDTSTLAECVANSRRQPTAADLDEVAPDHPVLLQDFSGHVTWVNSRALELAGIPGDHGHGGLLHDGDQAAVQRVLPSPTPRERVQVLRDVLATLNREGITSFTEPGLGPGGEHSFFGGMGAGVLDTFTGLAAAGELTARVSVLGLPSPMSGASVAETAAYLAAPPDLSGVDPRLVRLLGVKVFADGIPPSGTAWMHEEYPSGGHGSLCVHGHTEAARGEELAEILRLVHTAGLQLGIHVIGSRGIDSVVDALAAVAREHPRPDARHYLIHGQFASRTALARLGELGYGINMQPAIQGLLSDQMREMFGDEAADNEWPARSALDLGVATACSSDAPVTFPDWRAGVASLLSRTSKASGRVAGAWERIGLEEALRCYTINGARQDFAETWKGSITPGKVADLCVSGARTPEDIPSAPVEMTVFDGSVVFSAG
ncbi:amidohydrolase [Microtetraspora niveoalba]|uniref:amidohydrolase n=1 Tax=Microtetraspora niveoalba TaxID=46175 RepID=UPI0008375AAA|nr:amidohydrolase [Microtetraspora niveoalba]